MYLVLQAATQSVPQRALSLMRKPWSVFLGNSVAAMITKANTMMLVKLLKEKTVINGVSLQFQAWMKPEMYTLLWTIISNNYVDLFIDDVCWAVRIINRLTVECQQCIMNSKYSRKENDKKCGVTHTVLYIV